MKHLLLTPTALDVVVEPWEYVFTPAGAAVAALAVAAVVVVTVLLIRRFYGNNRKK